MIFANLQLAQRLERAEGEACREFAEARSRVDPASGATWIECGGAYAVFDGVDSPVTQSFGLGLFEPLTEPMLDQVEQFFQDRGAPVVHEVSPLAGVAALDLLSARGYRPIELSSVLYQVLAELPLLPVDAGIRVRIPTAKEAVLWADISARGWAHAMPKLLEMIRQFGKLAFLRANTVCFLAEVDGIPGAAGGLSLHEGVALFAGAATVPEMRKRGLQGALLAARKRYAIERGYTLGMMVTEAGSQSQRNAERQGFRVAYTRTKWQLK